MMRIMQKLRGSGPDLTYYVCPYGGPFIQLTAYTGQKHKQVYLTLFTELWLVTFGVKRKFQGKIF